LNRKDAKHSKKIDKVFVGQIRVADLAKPSFPLPLPGKGRLFLIAFKIFAAFAALAERAVRISFLKCCS
jgi:hypothetical protein